MGYLDNLIIDTDNYKHCHYPLYPKGTEYVSSYIESRGGDFAVTQFVGLQAFLREKLMKPISLEDIDEAEFVVREQGMHFNRENWMGILNDHGGFLPVEIEAVPEGTVLPARNVLVQVINTDPKYFWATSFFETALLRAVWYPTTIGTVSWLSKMVIREALSRTADSTAGLRNMLHDYGARGVSSQQSAALGGLAHLVNFDQSDTVPGILAAKRFYNAGKVSNSGPNSEHAGFCAWGRAGEADAMRNMLETMGPNGCALLLTDTYDHENAVKNIIGKELKDQIQSFPGLVGIRPDSGDIVEVTADTTEWLMDAFGYEVNSKGFKILPPFIRVVQGDGVNYHSLPQVYMELERRGLAADNAVFGMGGGLLQHWNRDTMNFGQKASAVCVNGEWRDISKQPTGSSMKASKKGRLALKHENGVYTTVPKGSIPESENVLQPVFRNGKLLKKWDFTELIANAEKDVPESYYIDHVGQMRTVSSEMAVSA
ncbi:nicotinate phosphoribosyltransferase [Pseudonocardia sp. KRD-184]|uniref:Nicotinate phosphoribosyltransferase n=1 Tax=Pseudonocardia oceani TaxID=2792013 RepID=A0ABS6U903_9PSEU|nr:nicotinate phosphoribosyltransferase [Pseudonocardia oceani]MBW0088500.1 nicotinate phosphoribosyltransferase [Pseudonocardia oceani]MBW0095358.1 nicotinate phosphoribosyltransferase [Pseudonocardia oceani]MBW0108525.1 nicotinate phosphoribosyltransferase [Pseudonocardia oceani]MBW0121821.1 nicotinate phosphoribosyltransferase [Pseudonocardia oceani]MBW0128458.1 nicotinate phosphoribosyltransferase [Pseudonocardia oceani]